MPDETHLDSSPTPTPLPQTLRIFWIASFIAFVLMVLIGYIEYRMGFPKPHYSPLGGSRYDDLTEYLTTYLFLHTTPFFGNPLTPPVAYPPFCAVLYALVYTFPSPVGFYLTTATVWLAAAVCGVCLRLRAEGIALTTAILFPATIVLLSFPIAGLLQRGNIELYLWIFSATGTWAYLRGKDDAAAVLWALAAATKLYPIVFLVLLLPRKRYRAFALGVIAFIAANVLSMWYLGPTISIAFHGSIKNVFGYQGVRVSEWSIHELAANHSIFGLAKLVAIMVSFPYAHLTLAYYGVAGIVFAVLFFGKLAKMPVANQLLAVSTFMVMLPPISYFYTLVHLYAPAIVLFFVAIRAQRAGVHIHGLRPTIFLLVPLFGSFMLFTFPRVVLFGGLIQACFLIVLFLYSVTYPFPDPGERNASTQVEAAA
jgi:hypothetical protein